MKQIKNIKTFIATLIFVLVLTPVPVYAWDDCPRGEVNDPYPGECARYIDTDNNGICDHSELAPEDRVEELVGTKQEDTSLKDDEEKEQTTSNTQKSQLETADQKPTSNPNSNNSSPPKPLISLGLVVLHLAGILTYVSYKKRKLSGI